MKRIMAATLVLAVFMAGYLAGNGGVPLSSAVDAQGDCQSFRETGKTACGEFLTYWKANGGLAQQGFPISDPFDEKSETDGKTYRVQYFERAVFELHPENPQEFRVLLTLLGSQKYKTRYSGTQPSGVMGVVSASPSVTMTVTPTIAATAAGATVAPATARPTNRYVNGDVAVTYHGIRENPPTTSFQAPKAGSRCVAVDVTIESTGSGTVNYNPFYLKLQTTDDRQYSYSGLCSSITPLLSPGDLMDGRRVRGWVTFEIPAGATLKSATWEGVLGRGLVTFPVP